MNTKLSLSVWSIASILGIVLGVLLLGQAVLLVSGTATSGAAGQTIVVDDNGDDCPNAEFQTIQAAVDEAASGDTVRVCSGNYSENVVVTTSNLMIQGQEQAILYDTDDQKGYGDCWSDHEGPKFTGFQISASNVTVRGFTLRRHLIVFYVHNAMDTDIQNNEIMARHGEDLASPCASLGVFVHNATRTQILDNNISETSYSRGGVHIKNSPHTVIQNNTISTNHSRAIGVWRSDGTHIVGNKANNTIRILWSNDTVLRDNTLEAGGMQVGAPDPLQPDPHSNWPPANSSQTHILNNQVHDGGIRVQTSHALIENNSIGINDTDSYGAVGWYGIGVLHTADDTLIRGNSIKYSTGAGIYAKSADNVTISSNTVSWSRYGIQIQGNLTGDVTGNTLRRNTDGLIVCGFSGGFSPGTPGCGGPGYARPSVDVTNNDIQSNVNSGILIRARSDPTNMSVRRNKFQNNGNFSIKNYAEGDLNATNNTFGKITPTSMTRGEVTPTEKPEAGFGIPAGLVGIILIIGFIARRRHY